jgi:hypothetical protein
MTMRASAIMLSTGAMLAVLLPASMLLPKPAAADYNWKQSSAAWKLMDICTRTARKQFPDYTAEAIAKRKAARQQCLRSNTLPGDLEPQEQPQQPAGR